jgi:hypothetical protein
MHQFFAEVREFAYAIYPTKHATYEFPFGGVSLRAAKTGGDASANFVQMTKYMAYCQIDKIWWNFDGPFVPNRQDQQDRTWRWSRLSRKSRVKDPYRRCLAVRTEDGSVQGAAIFTRGAASELHPGQRAVYVYNLAAAPRNRKLYARNPAYSGVGECLLILIAAQSYDWGYGGRIILHSLPQAISFYKKHGFVETDKREPSRIGVELAQLELTPQAADDLLEGVEVI